MWNDIDGDSGVCFVDAPAAVAVVVDDDDDDDVDDIDDNGELCASSYLFI